MQLTILHLSEADAGQIPKPDFATFSPFTCCVATQQLANASVQLAQLNAGTGCCATEHFALLLLYDPMFNNATSARARKCAPMHAYMRAQPLPDVVYDTGFQLHHL